MCRLFRLGQQFFVGLGKLHISSRLERVYCIHGSLALGHIVPNFDRIFYGEQNE